MKAYVRKVIFFDDEMDEFCHTPSGRDGLASLCRRKCSKLLAVTCAFLLILKPNRLRLINFLDRG